MGETFMVEGGEGLKTTERANLELEGLGISDLINFAQRTRRAFSQRQCYDVILGVEIDSSA